MSEVAAEPGTWDLSEIRSLWLAFVIFITGSCGGSSGPEPGELNLTVDEVAGNYDATSFTATDQSSGVETDLLAAGATLELSFGADGQLTGHVFVPEEVWPLDEEAAGAPNADLSGTWQLRSDDGFIAIDLQQHVFLDAMTLSASIEGPILASHVFDGKDIAFVLGSN